MSYKEIINAIETDWKYRAKLKSNDQATLYEAVQALEIGCGLSYLEARRYLVDILR